MKLNIEDIKKIITESVKTIMEFHDSQQLMLPFDGNTEPYNYMHFLEWIENIGTYGELPQPQNREFWNDPNNCYIAGEGGFYWGTGEELDEYGFNEFMGEFIEKYGDGEDVWKYGKPDVENAWPTEVIQQLTERGYEYWRKELIERGFETLCYWADNKLKFNNKGQIYCERLISVEKPLDRHKENYDWDWGEWNSNCRINSKYTDTNNPQYKERDYFTTLKDRYDDTVGCYWSYAPNGGQRYFDSDAYCGVDVVIKGWVNPEDVDWGMTISLETMEECEIRLNPSTKIQVDEIVYDTDGDKKKLPLKGSIILTV